MNESLPPDEPATAGWCTTGMKGAWRMLWLLREDVNQRDEMMYRGLRSEASETRPEPFPHDMPEEARLRLPLPPDWPPRRLGLTGQVLPDFWRTRDGSPVVSAALRQALDLPPSVAQVLPIELTCGDKRAHAKGYVRLRVLAATACADRAQSTIEQDSVFNEQTGKRVQQEWVSRFVLDPATVPPADLFRAEDKGKVLIATEALAARVLAGGFEGIVFGDPWNLDQWGDPQARRAANGSRVPYRLKPFGVRPVRDPAQRPPFVPDPALPHALRPIEAAVRHRLPAHYVRFLLNPPAELVRHKAERFDLLPDPISIAAENRDVRAVEDPYFHRGGGAWPEDWLVIGHDGCGNNFALDLGQPSPPVLSWDHEMAVASVRARSLEAYAADVVQTLREQEESGVL